MAVYSVSDLLTHQKFTDVSLVYPGSEASVQHEMHHGPSMNSSSLPAFRSHKAILWARCPYFAQLLDSGPDDVNSLTIPPKIRPNSFSLLLGYLYSDSLRFHSVDDGCFLLVGARTLGLSDLVRELSATLGSAVDVDTVCLIWGAARSANCVALDEVCKSFLCTNFEKVVRSAGFMFLEESALAEVVQSDNLRVASEEIVFDAVARWTSVHANAGAKNAEASAHKGSPMEFVRLAFVSTEYFLDVVVPSGLVARERLDEIYAFKLAPERFDHDPRFARRQSYAEAATIPKQSTEDGILGEEHSPQARSSPFRYRTNQPLAFSSQSPGLHQRTSSSSFAATATATATVDRPLSYRQSPAKSVFHVAPTIPDVRRDLSVLRANHSNQQSSVYQVGTSPSNPLRPQSALGESSSRRQNRAGISPLRDAGKKSMSNINSNGNLKTPPRMPASFSEVAHLDRPGISNGTLLWESTLRSPARR
eukprot:ANDGO_02560.mRNA.1 Ring canal kelch homolog